MECPLLVHDGKVLACLEGPAWAKNARKLAPHLGMMNKLIQLGDQITHHIQGKGELN